MMSRSKVTALAFGGILALVAGCRSFWSDDDFVIAERGRPAECTIVYAKGAGPVVKYAAEELRDYVKKLTDVELSINGTASRRIVLAHGGLCDVAPDGFVLTSADAGELRICGANPRGCLYGVYDLLERYGGVGFYTSWCEKVPRLGRLVVPAGKIDCSSPAFAMREPYWYDLNQHKEFSAKLRVNGYNHVKGEVPAKLGGDDFRFGGGLSSCYTFAKLCDPEVYFDSHPEYFSLVKGKRLKKGSQLCLTNPDVLEIVTSNVLARIRQDPGAKFYGVSQNDWYNYCECERCKAIDDEEGSHAGTMVRFVNAVAERVEKEFPDVLIETLAYQYTRKPPKKTRLRHNVVPCLCTIELDFARAIPESPFPQNRDFMSDIVGWGRQTDQLYVWDYVTQFTHYPCPFANVHALQGNVRFFRDNGVKMLFEQGAREGYHAGFAELKAWLLAKLMWNPDADVKALLDDFFDGYYGKAAPFVREYFEELHRRQRARSADPKHPLCIFDGVATPPYDEPSFMSCADEWWAQAEKAVAGTEPFAYNVKMGRFSHLYVKLEVKRAKKKDKELRADPEAVELARWLLKAKAEARGPMQVREWSEKDRIAGWQEIAKGPEMAAGVYDVRDFGAKGDGKTKDTAAIQAAIDAAAAAGGGEVFLGAGTYLSGSIYLKDNIDFHLGPGATLLGSDNPLDYSDPYAFKLNKPIWPSESSFSSHFVVCYERKNVTVRGPGKIDGNAKAFLVSPEGKVYGQGAIPWRPSQMLWFCQSEDVRVTDLEIANSTYWSCFFHGCDRVKVRGCRVHNNRHRRGTFHTHNGDGIDVDSCRWVSISDCDIDVADDGITLRASPSEGMRNRECAFVTVSNCRISTECNAVRVGVGNGRIHDAVFSNLSVYETRIAFNFSSSWSRGSHGCDFADIRFENCALDCGQFLYVDPIYATEATIGNVSFSGLTGRSYRPGRIYWNDPKLCGRILFRDVDLACGVISKNAPQLEISGGTLGKVDFPANETTKREWEVSDWGGYSDWGDCNYDPRNRKWKLVWSDEFDGTELDAKTWDYERGVVRNEGTPHAYTDNRRNVRVENGNLVLEVHKERVKNPKYKPGSKNWKEREFSDYSSGSVTTLGKRSFTYGKLEVRAKVPLGRGMWPAAWLMGVNIRPYSWPACGELDLMEWVGSDTNTVFGTMHWYDPVHPQRPAVGGGTSSFGQRLKNVRPWDGFHVYAIEWDRDSIVFLYDGIRYFTYDVNLATLHGTGPEKGEYNPFRKPLFLILNLAMGGDWAGEVDDAHVPGQYLIDYVRYYQKAP